MDNGPSLKMYFHLKLIIRTFQPAILVYQRVTLPNCDFLNDHVLEGDFFQKNVDSIVSQRFDFLVIGGSSLLLSAMSPQNHESKGLGNLIARLFTI